MRNSDLPLVSVVMNCYDSETYLKEAIDSIYSQDFDDWEIIFWDNKSTDGSAEIAKSYDSKLKYYLADTHTVLGAARNLALSKAKGKYISFLDCDDLYLPNKLSLQVNLMETYGFPLSYGSAIIIDEKGADVRKESVSYQSGNVFANLLSRYEINMQSVMIRRDILHHDQLSFDQSMRYCPDYKLFMEIASRYDLGVIEDYIVKYRHTANSLSKQTTDYVSSEIKYTLDGIFNRDPNLKEIYSAQVELSYGKLHYYDTINALLKNERVIAKRHMSEIKFQRWQYFLLYTFLYLPISDKLILQILKR